MKSEIKTRSAARRETLKGGVRPDKRIKIEEDGTNRYERKLLKIKLKKKNFFLCCFS